MHHQTERKHIRSTLAILNDGVRAYGAAKLLPLLTENGKRFTLDNYKPEHLDSISEVVRSFEDEKRTIDGLLLLANDATRFTLFMNLALFLSDKGYWYALGQAYTGSDWLDRIPLELKRQLFSSSKPHREFLMDLQEQDFYNRLPAKVRIFRAMSMQERKSENFGISWSLSEERANFFANDYSRHHMSHQKVVYTIEVKRANLIAYFSGRKEEEVIFLPDSFLL